jgi:DNA-binding NarL/FixJ family response regulator
MTTVLICDDHRQVRDGLLRSVQTVPGVARVDTADSAEEVLRRWPVERPDLVLLGTSLAGPGVDAVRRLVRQHPDANVVMLTSAADRDVAALAIAEGARGYLHRDVSREELCAALAHAIASAELGGDVRRAVPAPRAPELTEREVQVLRGMAAGKSNAEIGRELYLSEDTIKTHARRLFRKMSVNDRAQAVAAGFRFGLVR